MQKEMMIMNATNPSAEVNATLALSDLNRRERLLKIIRGKPAWVYLVSGVIWLVVILYLHSTEKADLNTAFYVLVPLGFAIVGMYLDLSRRMIAFIELIGEENLRREEKWPPLPLGVKEKGVNASPGSPGSQPHA